MSPISLYLNGHYQSWLIEGCYLFLIWSVLPMAQARWRTNNMLKEDNFVGIVANSVNIDSRDSTRYKKHNDIIFQTISATVVA